MSKKTSYLLGLLLTLILGSILYYFFCCKPCLEASKKDVENQINLEKQEVLTTTKNKFLVTDSKNNLQFAANDHFNFKGDSFSIIEPISKPLQTQVERLSTYLTDNPTKVVDITGYYTSDENNTSAFPNLGLARANAVKNYFVSNGMSSKALNSYGKLDDGLVPDASNTYYGPLSYALNTRDKNDTNEADSLKVIYKNIKANPLILYFDTASASINLTVEQREKVSQIVRYIDKTDKASIKTIGHSDNTGNRENNIKLGLDRAEFAKNYLVSNGVSSSKIKASSKGPDEPIADNATEDGKAKNRRVVVTLN